MGEFHHISVMASEALTLLCPERGGVFVDGTLGGGGHAYQVLSRLPEGAKLYGIDRDAVAIEAASERLAEFGTKFKAIHGNFFDMKALLSNQGVRQVDGILLDLGVSSYQFDTAERGFSYQYDAPLDMRMDQSAALSAYDVVNGYSAEELASVIGKYGEERFAMRIANAIVKMRTVQPIENTLHLAEIVKNAIPAPARRNGPHPARRTFQALRIEVNGELEGLEQAVRDAHDLLAPGGILAVITFHSLEDRIIKQLFRDLEHPCICDPKAPQCTCGKKPTVRVLTKKPIVADEEELENNPRARSAKLRAVEKLEHIN